MTVRTQCSACGKVLKVSTDHLGRKLRCPKCQADVTNSIPAEPALSLPPSDGIHGELRNSADASRFIPSPFQGDGQGEGSSSFPASETIANPNASAPTPTAKRPTTSGPPILGKVGRFELRSVLGQGAFGRVYRAYDPLLDREVALKLPKFATDDPRQIERFLREAKAAARLRHPNIVAVYESGKAGDDYYIASEFIDGVPLSVRLKENPPDFRQSAEWVRDLAEALAYAHSEGIIHRDIKPANIMIDQHDRPQLMDFGLAKRLTDDSTMTTEGGLIGTPAYMSPEQASGNFKEVGPHSDQYSLGIVLYELLCGQRPFDGPVYAVIAKIVSDEPTAPTRVRPSIPTDLQAICQRATCKSPLRRYPDIYDLRVDLSHWLKNEPIAARSISYCDCGIRWCRRQPAFASVIGLTFGALLVAAALGVSFAIYQSRAAEQLAKSATDLNIRQTQLESALRDSELQSTRAQEEKKCADLKAREAIDRANEAESEKVRADLQTKRAEESLKIASEQRKLADESRNAALEAQDAEKLLRIETQKALAQSEIELYFNRVTLADRELLSGNAQKVIGLLEQCHPSHRQWEWQYLMNCTGATKRIAFDAGAPVQRIAFGANGKLLACRAENSVIVWETEKQKLVRKVETEVSRLRDLAISADGDWIVYRQNDETLKAWHVPSGRDSRFPDTIWGSIGIHGSLGKCSFLV